VDEAESEDVAVQYPAVFNEMKEALDAWISTLPETYLKTQKP